MFASTSWVTVTFTDNLFPYEGRFLLIERDRVEVFERSVEYLVSSIDVESKFDERYLWLKEQAAL